MKTIKKLKGLIFGAFALIVSAVLAITISNFTQVKAAVNVEITYELYSFDEYLEYTSMHKAVDYYTEDAKKYDDFKKLSGSTEMADTAWAGGMSSLGAEYAAYDIYATGDNTMPAAAYWASFFSNGSSMTYDQVTTAINNVKNGGKYFTKSLFTYTAKYPDQATAVTADDYIVVVVKASIPTGSNLASISVPLDLTGITAVDTTGGLGGKYTEGISNTIKTDGSSKVYVQSDTSTFDTAIAPASQEYPTVGGNPATGKYLSGNITLGAIATKVSSSPSNPMTIGYVSGSTLLTGVDSDLTEITFTQTTKSPTVIGGSSNVADISSVKINSGSAISKGATQTLGYDTFTSGALASTVTSLSIDAKPDQAGTITSAEFIIKDSDAALTSSDFSSASAATLGSSKGNPVTIASSALTGWTSGTTVYVKLHVLATNNTDDNYFIVAIPKAKSTTKALSNITVSKTSGGAGEQLYSSNSATATTMFTAGTLNYHSRVASSVTNLFIKPQWTDGTIKSVTVDGNAVTKGAASPYGSEISIPISASAKTSGGQHISIVVTAQDNSTQTYNIYVHQLSDNTDLAASASLSATSTSGTTKTATPSGYAGSVDLPYGSNAFTAKAILKETGQTLEYSTDSGANWTSIASNTATPQVNFASGLNSDTKTVLFRVTSEDTEQTQIYTFTVNREGGSKKSGLAASGINIKIDGGTADQLPTVDVTTLPSNSKNSTTYTDVSYTASVVANAHSGNDYTYTITGLKHAVNNFTIQINGDEPSKQTITYSVDGGAAVALTSGAYTGAISFSNNTLVANVGSETKNVKITITAQDTTAYSEYNIAITRGEADDDSAIDTSNFLIYTLDSSSAKTQYIYTESFASTGVNEYTLDLTGSKFAYSVAGLAVNADFNKLAKATASSNVVTTENYNLTRTVDSSKFSFSGTVECNMTITIVVTAENFSQTTYKILATRKEANDSKKVTVVAEDANGISYTLTESTSGTGYVFNPSTSLPFTNRFVKLTISSQDGVATTKIKEGTTASGTDVTGTQSTYYIDDNSSPVTTEYDNVTPRTFDFRIVTEANPSGYPLKINVWRDAADIDTSLNGGEPTEVKGSLDNLTIYKDPTTSTSARFVYELTKSTGGSTYYLDLSANSSKAKIYTSYTIPTVSTTNIYDPSFLTQFGTAYSKTATYDGGKPLYVTVVAESGARATYTIDVKFYDEREKGHEITSIVVTKVDGTALDTPINFSAYKASESDEKNNALQINIGTINVPYAIGQLKVEVNFNNATSSKAVLNSAQNGVNGTISFGVGTTDFYYQGKAENTSCGCIYVLTVVRANAETGQDLLELAINANQLITQTPGVTVPFDKNDNIIHLSIGRVNNMTIKFGISAKASYTISGVGPGTTFVPESGTSSTGLSYSNTSLSLGQKYTITLSVKSELATVDSLSAVNIYTIYVYTAEQNYEVSDINLYKETAMTNQLLNTDNHSFSFVATTNTYPDFNVKYKDNPTAYAEVLLKANSANAHISGNAQKTLSPGNNDFVIDVESEYSYLASLDGIVLVTPQKVTYTIPVVKAAPSSDNKLKSLSVKYSVDNSELLDGSTAALTFAPGKFTYAISNAPCTGSQGVYIIDAEVNHAEASMAMSNTDTGTTNQVTLTVRYDALGNAIHERVKVIITVTAEDGTPQDYAVTISTGNVVQSKDNSIKSVVVLADNDSSTNVVSYNPTVPTITGQVRPTVDYVFVTIDANDRSSSLFIEGVQVSWNTATRYQVQNKPGLTTLHVVSKAEDSTIPDREYTIEITSLSPDPDRSLTTFKLEVYDESNVLVETTNLTNTSSTINVSNKVVKAKLTVAVKSLYATVSPSNTGDARVYEAEINPLVIGDNNFAFVVTSEDTNTTAYTVVVYRDDYVTLDIVDISKDGSTQNIVDVTDPTTYDFSVDYTDTKLNLVFVTTGDESRLTVTGRLGTSNLSFDQNDPTDLNKYSSDLSLNVGSNKLTITVKGKKDQKQYVFNITRKDGNSQNFILSYTKEDGDKFTDTQITTTVDGNPVVCLDSDREIVYLLSRDYLGQQFNPTIEVSATAKLIDGYKYQITTTNRIFSLGANNFQIKVTSETDVDRMYSIKVYVADKGFAIDNIQLLDDSGNNLVDVNSKTLQFNKADSNRTFDFKYPYSVNTANLVVTTESSNAKVLVNKSLIGNSAAAPTKFKSPLSIKNSERNAAGEIVFEIVVQSEYYTFDNTATRYKSEKYVIVIEKENANTDTSLKTLTVTAGTKTYNIYVDGVLNTTDTDISISGTDITLTNAGTISSFGIVAVPNKLPAMTSLTGVVWNSNTGQGTQNVQIPTDSASQSHSIVVYGEADPNVSTSYNIILYRGSAINPDDDNVITGIEIYDSTNEYYLGGSAGVFQANNLEYTFNTSLIKAISYGDKKAYTIVVKFGIGSLAKAKIDNDYVDSRTKSIVISYPADGANYTKTHTITSESKNGDVSAITYTINVVALAAGTDANLIDLRLDSTNILANNPETGIQITNYDFTFAANKEFVSVMAESSDEKASIKMTNTKTGVSLNDSYGEFDLDHGNNVISVLVTAENGKTTKSYTISVFRDYESPLLKNIEVSGYKLLNSSYTSTVDFDERGENTHYYVKILYGVTTFEVNAELKEGNQTYTVIGNGLTVKENLGITRVFTGTTKEGTTDYTITVRSPQGKFTKYTLTVKLNDALTASTNITSISTTNLLPSLPSSVKTTTTSTPTGQTINVIDPEASGISNLPGVVTTNEDGTARVFQPLGSLIADYNNADSIQNYGPYIVANKVRSIDKSLINFIPEKLADTEGGQGAQVSFVSGKNLNVGDNQVVVQIVSEDGNNVRTIILDVVRLGNEYELEIDEIKEFKNDFNNDTVNEDDEAYVVSSSVSELNFSVANRDTTDSLQPDVKVISGQKLVAGKINTVVALITPKDGSPAFEQEVKVYREPYEFTVESEEISGIKDDYAKDEIKPSYTVPSNVSTITFDVANKNSTDESQQPTYRITNDGKLNAGENKLTLTITDPDGNVTTKAITVYRTPYTFEVSTNEIADVKDDYATDEIETVTYTVGSSVDKLNFSVINSDKTAGAAQPTYTLSNNGELKVGENNLVLTINSPDGTVITKKIKVIRESYVYKVTSPEIAAVEKDYTDGKIETATYSVASNVSKISFAVANANDTAENQQPTYSISNGGILKVGENKLVLTITSPEGTVTRKEITVTRAHMEYTVNKTLNTFACEEVAGKDRYYTINLVDKTANAITDYKAYITFNSEKNDLVVEDLTGEKTPQTNEVLIRVSTSDGAESEVIHFQLTSSQIGTSGAWFDILFWVLLAIAIIILIIILICVNKDKYGSISKKRKNA